MSGAGESLPLKNCTNAACPCDNPQPLGGFSKDRSRKDGLCGRCKTCNRNDNVKHKPRISQRRARYRKECGAELAAKQRIYHNANKEACLARRREYQRRNKERLKAKNKEWKRQNRERLARWTRAYRRANRERTRENKRRMIARNPEHFREMDRLGAIRRRARLRGASGVFSAADIALKFELQGGICYYCPADLEQAGYHIDHKIPLVRGGSNWPANLCCACPTCNVRKSTRDFWEFLARAA